MQNKPNFQKTKMSANIYIKKDYKDFRVLGLRKNKPKTKPISNEASTNRQEKIQIMFDFAVGGR